MTEPIRTLNNTELAATLALAQTWQLAEQNVQHAQAALTQLLERRAAVFAELGLDPDLEYRFEATPDDGHAGVVHLKDQTRLVEA